MDEVETAVLREKAILWLRDKNIIQRNVHLEHSGKKSIVEHDLSGGQAALIRLLRENVDLGQELCQALASALEPIGCSLLQLRKRLRRSVGRPSKKGTVRDSFEVSVIPDDVKRKHSAKPPQKAAGEASKPVKIGDAIKNVGKERKIGKTKINGLMNRRRAIDDMRLKNNEK